MILERGTETAVIGATLSVAASGRGATAVLEAPAGMGKTTLLDLAAEQAAAAGMDVLRATGSVVETSLPFGVARQLFERRLLSDRSATAVRAAGVLGLRGAPATRTEPHAASDALYWLAADLSSSTPLLLAVDDAHWADVPSLRCLHHLANRISDHPIALLVAMRPMEPGAADPLLAELTARVATVLRPGPLSESAIADLIAAGLDTAPDAAVVAACASATGGNAFLVSELVRSLAGSEPTVAAVQDAAPDGVRRRVAASLARVPPPAAELAAALAILGESELPRLAELAGMDVAAAGDAARALERADLIAFAERTACFAHPLIASVVAAAIPTVEASAAHGRAARVLAGAQAPLDACAAHLLAALPAGDAWVVEVLRDAAAAAADRGAPEAAVAYLRRALAEPPDADELPALLLAAGTAELRIREFGAAIAALERGLELAPEPALQVSLGQALSQAQFLDGRYAEAADALELARLSESDPDRRLVVEANLLSLDLLDPARWTGAQRRLQAYRRRDAAGELHEPTLLALLGATSLLAAKQSRDAGVELLQRARENGLGAAGEHAFAFGWAITSLEAADHADLAQRWAEDALATARREGDHANAAYLLVYTQRFNYRLGRLADAEATGRLALGLLESLGDAWTFPFGLIDVLVERDGLAEAQRLVEAIPRAGSPQYEAIVSVMRGRVAAAAGEHAQALELLLGGGALLDELELLAPQYAPWRVFGSGAALALGQTELAERLAVESLALAEVTQVPTAIAAGLRARAAVVGGIDDLRAAVDVLAGNPDGLARAGALADLGAALHAGGEDAEAREHLRAGLAAAHDAGALTVAEYARRELVAAGGRPRRAALRGVDALTPSELQVARLAAEGMTNREIAETQFVTVKTVEQHLARAYAKLGIDGRRDLEGALG